MFARHGLFVLLLLASSAAPTPAAPNASSAPADRAFSLAGDTWQCETEKNSNLATTFSQSRSALDARTVLLPQDPRLPTIPEHYTFDDSSGKWSAVVADGAFTGSAGTWSSDVWTFLGSTVVGRYRFPGKMVFTYLDDNAFRRDFELESKGSWQIYSVETCSRGLPP